MADETEVCSNCSHPLKADETSCPECGHEQETTAPEPAAPKRGRKTLLIVIALVVIAAIAAVAAFTVVRSAKQKSVAEQQYDDSAPALMTILADMAGVNSTQMVRDVAAEAEPEVEALDATLENDPQDPATGQLSTMRDAFAALAALTEYTQADTEVWAQNREPLIDDLNALSSYGGATENASSQGDGAVQALDDLTRRVDTAMAKYQKQLDELRSQARSQRYDLDAYYSQMEPLVNSDNELQRKTDAYIKRLRTKELFMFEVMDYFSTAAADTREIADQMATVSAPYDLYEANQALVAAVTARADSMDDVVATLQDADCDYGECYFEWDKQWNQDLRPSPEVADQYQQAYKAWQEAVQNAEVAATGQELPQRPNL